ncbi:MAG: glycosyltransferase family 39 protein [Anaerolineae bacterium]|nr:glycosyltransferase family 39 protein [Anaerolineae bacterium]
MLSILCIAGWVRLYNLDWDEGTHLHPDERYLTMVANGLRFPESLTEYWDTATSPLNPANQNQPGYVYGTLPLFITRFVGEWLDRACGEMPAGLPQFIRMVLFTSDQPCWAGTYVGYGGIHLVGRYLSTLADLLSLLGLVLMARLLYNQRIALLAGALYAFAVLPIQHAHFFVVDSFATVFVMWTLYLVAYAVMREHPWALTIAGITTGLAVASKISVWPVAGIVALGSILTRQITDEDDASFDFALSVPRVIAVIISGILAAITFRVAQPYAFTGPGFFGVHINPQWMETMRGSLELASGKRDAPYGHQWTERTPIIFPWLNMVFWGMGLPLGITAWLGWLFISWRTVFKSRWRHLIPWGWGTFFFLYQGIQWVKSMRYLLPVYPVFALFAAWLLIRGFEWARTRHSAAITYPSVSWQRYVSPFSYAMPALVLVGTILWATAFLQIYVRPVTRIEASQWMFRNIPTAATVKTVEGVNIQLPVKPDTILSKDVRQIGAPFVPEVNGTLNAVVLNKVQGLSAVGVRTIRVRLTSDPAGTSILAEATTTADIPQSDTVAVTILLPSTQLEVDKTLYLFVDLLEGSEVILKTSVVANEHWDDPLPLRIEGKDPFGNWYQGLTSSSNTLMNLYDNDTLEKRQQLLDWLDEADYIVMSSNRLYGSIPRLPLRYPLATAYYEAMFNGSLGFELLAEFVSFPALGTCQFPDQDSPFGVPEARYTNARPCSILYPPAEEAYSVYDHPQVLIFAKTSAYSHEKALALLPPSLVENVQWMTPLQATKGIKSSESFSSVDNQNTKSLLMSSEMRTVQEAGGTWSELFNRNALQNRAPIVAVFIWWLMLIVLGWLAFPWLYRAFPALEYRGYALAKAAGLLIWVYPTWLLASLHLVPYTRLSLWCMWLLFAVVSFFAVRARWDEMRAFVIDNWKALLWSEGLYLVLYLTWVYVRYLNPDLWHPVVGGEKPMDFAYLNAVIKSTWFPPYDPWFAGGIMNYYYFGFVMIASLIKALGIIPSIAYNLAVPAVFAMTGVGAYTLAANLVNENEHRQRRRAGMLGLALVLLLGNLGEVRLLFKGFETIGKIEFDSFIPGYPALISALRGFWKVVVKGESLLFRPEWWYWDATRVIPYNPGEAGTINEFPLFTFLYADLHAHMLAFPFTQLALAVALQWGLGLTFVKRPFRSLVFQRLSSSGSKLISVFLRFLAPLFSSWFPQPIETFFIGALTVGALRSTNTWDYPTYIGLIVFSVVLSLFKNTPSIKENTTTSEETSEDAVFSNTPTPSSFSENETQLGDNASHTAPLLSYPSSLFSMLRLLVPVLMVVLAEILFLPYTRHNVTVYNSFQMWSGSRTPLGIFFIMHGHFLFPLTVMASLQGYRVLRRLWKQHDIGVLLGLGTAGSGLILLLGVLVFLDIPVVWIVVPLGALAMLFVLDTESSSRMRLLWFWVGTALILSLMVEIIVLEGDIGRMNTVFKFYLQVWMLLALATAVAVERILMWIFHQVHPIPNSDNTYPNLKGTTGDIILGLFLLLFFGTALYPALAIPARVRDRWISNAPHSLDGMAYMPYATQYEHGGTIPLEADYRVIRWLQDNVTGSPTIIEGQAEREYLWGNRISIYTGLPAVASWRWHQVQQRMVMPANTVEQRQYEIRGFYATPDVEHARQVLEKYQIEYIIFGPYERAYTIPEGVPKFDTMVEKGWLEIVYQDEYTTIYHVQPA